jgi:hypothetical protein
MSDRERKRERAREIEKRVRDSVWLDRVTASVINSEIGRIPWNSKTGIAISTKFTFRWSGFLIYINM